MRFVAHLFDRRKNQNKDEQKSIKVQIKSYSKLPVNEREREKDQKPRAIQRRIIFFFCHKVKLRELTCCVVSLIRQRHTCMECVVIVRAYCVNWYMGNCAYVQLVHFQLNSLFLCWITFFCCVFINYYDYSFSFFRLSRSKCVN